MLFWDEVRSYKRLSVCSKYLVVSTYYAFSINAGFNMIESRATLCCSVKIGILLSRSKSAKSNGDAPFRLSIDSFVRELDEYLHWYNAERIKMSLGGMSPLQHRRSLGIAT